MNYLLTKQPHSRRRRPGAIIILVLAMLVVVTVLANVMLKQFTRTNRSISQHRERMQAEWLVIAATQRTHLLLQEDATYSGESWQISAGAGARTFVAEIQVIASKTDENGRRMLIELQTETGRVLLKKQSSITLNSPGEDS